MKRCCASSASYFFKLRLFICASAPVDGTVHAMYIQIVLIDESAAASYSFHDVDSFREKLFVRPMAKDVAEVRFPIGQRLNQK
jgi:hypothetical protein